MAWCLACEVIQDRCGPNVAWFDAWRARAEGGPEHPNSLARLIETVVGMCVGLPTTPKPVDQVEAFVSEQLWYRLCEAIPDTDPCVRLIPPSLEVTEIGGDGLAIHRLAEDKLLFRLWEVKKHVGTQGLSKTVSRAYAQLGDNALKYLAKISAANQHDPDEEIAEFFGRLMELWADASPEAAAGVWVGISTTGIPARCFTTFGQWFPAFVDPRRLMGALSAIDDFPAFAAQVRDWLWSGL